MFCDFDNLERKRTVLLLMMFLLFRYDHQKAKKTKENMYKSDVEYPLAIAELASEKGAEHFLLISSMNANENSLIWYSKMKGED
ncbi:hypothetical protein KHA80_22890 [Anaerobacillus sp. HL2]|nr:hypothetical protein KHA80_22890 [Anaerobacillus sp. HL2]